MTNGGCYFSLFFLNNKAVTTLYKHKIKNKIAINDKGMNIGKHGRLVSRPVSLKRPSAPSGGKVEAESLQLYNEYNSSMFCLRVKSGNENFSSYRS